MYLELASQSALGELETILFSGVVPVVRKQKHMFFPYPLQKSIKLWTFLVRSRQKDCESLLLAWNSAVEFHFEQLEFLVSKFDFFYIDFGTSL